MTDVEVLVSLADRDALAGTLYSRRGRGTESATFMYAAEYLAHPGAYALDPELPLRIGASHTRLGQALFGALTDSAPDRWGRTLIARSEARAAREEGRTVRSLGEIDFLLGVRDDLRHGALRLRVGDGPFLAEETAGVPALTDLSALLDLAARAEDDSASLDDLRRLVRVGSSLGGARPKAHVLDEGGRIAIAKFPCAKSDTWNVMAWEKVALDLAERAGIDVTPSRLLNLAGRHVLVVDRFDRTADNLRIGYASAMTMLEASDGDQRSYLEIADVVERVSLRATEELSQLWRRIIFSILISNTDDHLRNHGFLHVRGDSWRLSPAFDLNPDPSPGPRYLSTAIDESDTTASIELALAVAPYFRLSSQAAQDVLKGVAGAVSRWRDVSRSHGLADAEIEQMAPAFAMLDDPPDR